MKKENKAITTNLILLQLCALCILCFCVFLGNTQSMSLRLWKMSANITILN